MAPEAFRGDVSVKLDVFSFGIVLLELLTGLKPFDETRDEQDLLSYVEENVDPDNDDAGDCLDRRVDWQLRVARELFKIARQATLSRKKDRPTMVEVLATLEVLQG